MSESIDNTLTNSLANSIYTRTSGSFPYFTRLPAETRLQIWRLAVVPRTVIIRLQSPQDGNGYFFSPQPAPALVQTCRESRSGRLYTKAFTIDESTHYIWFNFAIDKIRIEDNSLAYIPAQDAVEICRAIIEFGHVEFFIYCFLPDIHGMKKLRELEILPLAALDDRDDILRHIQEQFDLLSRTSKVWSPTLITTLRMAKFEDHHQI
jgi:hypothetical protein